MKKRNRSFIFAGIAVLGIGYEIFFSSEIQPFLIVMYVVVILFSSYYYKMVQD